MHRHSRPVPAQRSELQGLRVGCNATVHHFRARPDTLVLVLHHSHDGRCVLPRLLGGQASGAHVPVGTQLQRSINTNAGSGTQ